MELGTVQPQLVSLFFQDKGLAFDVKGVNLYAQPSTLETVAMIFENKK